jgi:hypothetical protein
MGKIKDGLKDTMWRVNDFLDNETRTRFYQLVMKEEKIGYEDAVDLCVTDPQYSLGLKMASPMIMTALKTQKGIERFRELLEPEELEIFNRDVAGMPIRKMWKEQKKKKNIS